MYTLNTRSFAKLPVQSPTTLSSSSTNYTAGPFYSLFVALMIGLVHILITSLRFPCDNAKALLIRIRKTTPEALDKGTKKNVSNEPFVELGKSKIEELSLLSAVGPTQKRNSQAKSVTLGKSSILPLPLGQLVSSGECYSHMGSSSSECDTRDSERNFTVSDSEHTLRTLKETKTTTAMLRNIPNKYTQDMLIDVLGKMCIGRTFDFLYLPIDYETNCNMGYAFINFHSTEGYFEFSTIFNGYCLPGFKSKKVCTVSPARVQGLETNISHFRNSPVMCDHVDISYKPILLNERGEKILFPSPDFQITPKTPWRRRLSQAEHLKKTSRWG